MDFPPLFWPDLVALNWEIVSLQHAGVFFENFLGFEPYMVF